MTKKFLIVLLVICSGCATSNFGNISFQNAPKGIPSNRAGIIYIMREAVKPTMLNPRILVNNIDVGKLPNNSFIWIEAKPGVTFVDTKWGWDAGTNNDTHQLNIEPGKTYYLVLKPVGQGYSYPYFYRFYNEFFELEEGVAIHVLEKLKFYQN